MNVLVCIKRVPDTGARFELTGDGQEIDTRNLEFTISPHEECAVEEAIELIEAHGGNAAALTLGPAVAAEQIREALAKGIERGILIETDGGEWDPAATAGAIVKAIQGQGFDLILFGNESADAGNYQVPVRVAEALGWPCATGIKDLELANGQPQQVIAKREISGGWEVFKLSLPAVIAVKEGINNPRHPSLRGIMAAKKKEIQRLKPEKPVPQLVKLRLKKPPEGRSQIKMLGEGAGAVTQIVQTLKELGVIGS